MKTLTSREFFQSPSVAQKMPAGETVLVTDNGKASLIVTKVVRPPRKTRADLEREAQQVSRRKGPKINFTEAIRELKGR